MEPNQQPKIIIGVPGLWKDREKIVESIAKKNDGKFIYAGETLFDANEDRPFDIELYAPDPNLQHAFEVAGEGRLEKSLLKKVKKHHCCVYIIGPGGSMENALAIMKAAQAIIKAGGLAVKIESAGKAHSIREWESYLSGATEIDLIKAFVLFVGGSGSFYSCGMHNLGYPDCTIDANIDNSTAANLMQSFLTTMVFEKPELNTGQTFSIDDDAPIYKLRHEPCWQFPPGDPFHNPYGIWKLAPA